MSCSGKVLRIFEFLHVFGAAEKNKEKVQAKFTGFSVEFFGSQWTSVSSDVLFCQENKNSNFDNFFSELDKNLPTSS